MISVLEQRGQQPYNNTEFLADTIDDIAKIPRAHAGDRVYIIKTQEWFILDSLKIWQPLQDEIFVNDEIGG